MDYTHMRYPGGKTKAVTFSYDDGVRQDLRLSGLTEKYGIRCTFNINSGLVAETPGGDKLTYAEIKENILDKGHEVAVHGEHHIAPGSSRTLVGLRDALNCRLQLEQNLGVIIRGMAYPNSGIRRFTGGSDYGTVRQYLHDIGIVYARSLAEDNNGFLPPDDWYRWIPTAHHNNPKVLDWANEFTALNVDQEYMDNRYPRLFYLWGHSYEFDMHDNWEHIENICGILGGKEDTWYATNIDIYDYINAFRSLIFSADGTRVYNPTLWELYFETEMDLRCVKPGEVLEI